MFELAKLQDFAPRGGLQAGAYQEQHDDTAWIDVSIPGDVHRALIAAGRLADPFYDRNEADCAWMEEREWWYRLRFDGPDTAAAADERLRLILHGVDTFATFWLNGEELGRSANMFRPAIFDLTGKVRSGSNTLAICFDRPYDHLEALADVTTWGRNEERVAMRKAQFGYGWDWGPRLPTIGLWRPVELRRERKAVLDGVHVATQAIAPDTSRAVLCVTVEVAAFAAGPLGARVQVRTPGGDLAAAGTLSFAGEGGRRSGLLYLQVERPLLWWTHDLGDSPLYTVSVDLQDGETVLDRSVTVAGIRTIVLDQSPDHDEPGTRFFRFVLNGVPLFAKGADWIPADSFVGAIPPSRYTMLLEAARDGNMNMLRVWGGGLYEHDVFYDQCDRLGLLIWQDFMFTCAPYPEANAAFAAEVEAEAVYQVRRLRSHPSMALWCGNNENQWIHDMSHWDHPVELVPGSLFYGSTLPRVVTAEDGFVPYWPGSPYGGNDFNSMDDGDRHNWDVWHGQYPRRFGEPVRNENTVASVSYKRYAEDMGRFLSEFGMHAAPVLQTLQKVIPPDQLYHHSPSMDWHNKDNPKNKGDNLMISVTGVPETLDQYIDYSMIAQAEGLKFGIEHYRRRTPHCSGALVWQLNDCWPVLSWSVMDYYGVGKAGYFYLRRVFEPVLTSFKELADGGVELWITNDRRQSFDTDLDVRLGTFAGAALFHEHFTASAAAHSSVPVRHWTANELQGAKDRYLWVSAADPGVRPNRHFFAPIKDLRRDRPAVQLSAAATGVDALEVTLRSDGYAFFVHLLASDPSTRFSDNYFDLQADQSVMVRVTAAGRAPQPGELELQWR